MFVANCGHHEAILAEHGGEKLLLLGNLPLRAPCLGASFPLDI